MSLKSKKGFTLIEILVVVSIVGLLSSVFLVGLGGFRARGRDARRIADLRQVQNALEIYYTRCGRYLGGVAPASGACPTTNPTAWGPAGTAGTVQNVLTSGLGISQIPNDPSIGKNYGYAVSTDGQNYVLGATLENPGDAALVEDSDTALTGFNATGGFTTCADPVYCIQF